MIQKYLTLLAQLIQDEAELLPIAARESAIMLAVKRYSQDRPQTLVTDISATGVRDISLPGDWEHGFSRVLSIEYPIGQWPPLMIEPHRYGLYQSPSGILLSFDFIPAALVRMTYTISHAVSDVVSTIPNQNDSDVATLAASICCEMLSSWYANASDSTIQADKVERSRQSKDYNDRAIAFRQRYLDGLGVIDKRSAPAGEVVNLHLNDSRGQDRLTHPRIYR